MIIFGAESDTPLKRQEVRAFPCFTVHNVNGSGFDVPLQLTDPQTQNEIQQSIKVIDLEAEMLPEPKMLLDT